MNILREEKPKMITAYIRVKIGVQQLKATKTKEGRLIADQKVNAELPNPNPLTNSLC